MEEAALIQDALAGNEAAKEALVLAHRRRLLATAWHFLGHQDPDAEDVVQETFLAAFRSLAGFEGRSSLYTWLNHICVNQCFNRIRQRKRQLAMEREDLERLLAPTPSPMEGEQALRRRRLELLDAWIARLGGKCREILGLRIREGLALVEIKDRLRVPLGTVASRLKRCQENLQAIARQG